MYTSLFLFLSLFFVALPLVLLHNGTSDRARATLTISGGATLLTFERGERTLPVEGGIPQMMRVVSPSHHYHHHFDQLIQVRQLQSLGENKNNNG